MQLRLAVDAGKVRVEDKARGTSYVWVGCNRPAATVVTLR